MFLDLHSFQLVYAKNPTSTVGLPLLAYHILTQFEGSYQQKIVFQTPYQNNFAFNTGRAVQFQTVLPSIIASNP